MSRQAQILQCGPRTTNVRTVRDEAPEVEAA
jgi:hypothetical protein